MDFIQLQKINVAIGTALGWHNFILNDEYGPDRALKPGQKAELNCYFTDLPNFYEILISNGEDKRDAERYRRLRSKGLKFIDFEYGAAKVTRLFSDDEKGWICLGVATPKSPIAWQIYVTKTGKVRVFKPQGKELK